MLNVEQNTENTLILSLSGYISGDIDATGYTLTLTNEYNNRKYENIYLEDISLYPGRYNEFILELVSESSQIDYSNGIIYLEDNGYYKYEAYYDDELIETGLMNVTGDFEIETYDYTTNDDTSTYSIHTTNELTIYSGDLTAGKSTTIRDDFNIGYFRFLNDWYGSIEPTSSIINMIYWDSYSGLLKATLFTGTASKLIINGTKYTGNFVTGVSTTNPFEEDQTYTIKIIK